MYFVLLKKLTGFCPGHCHCTNIFPSQRSVLALTLVGGPMDPVRGGVYWRISVSGIIIYIAIWLQTKLLLYSYRLHLLQNSHRGIILPPVPQCMYYSDKHKLANHQFRTWIATWLFPCQMNAFNVGIN